VTGRPAAVLLAAAVLAGCGGDDGGGEEPETRACGSVSAVASDSPGDITARGVDCATARAVARLVTVEGDEDKRTQGFDCSDVDLLRSGPQRCTRGDAEITWVLVQG
jgi:hypothetical protein